MMHKQQGGATTPVLITILLFVIYIVWSETIISSFMEETLPVASESNVPLVAKDEIISVELIDINYWEARFKVNYRHRTGRPDGYLAVIGEKWSPNVGLKTAAGEKSGMTYLSRKYAHENSYFDTFIEARMYNPYRADHNFAVNRFPLDLLWPGEEALPKMDEESKNRFARLGEVVVYRNIPNYVGFAEKLTENGFPPHKITMMLSVCPNCSAGLLYGDNVEFDELQTILVQLQQHGISLSSVYHSTEAKHVGKIHIGNTPPKDSKPLWKNITKLTDSTIQNKEFFNILGFPIKGNLQLAIDKTEKSKRYINSSSKKNYKYARSLLDQAMKLDSSYIPAYLESARLIMKEARFNEEYPSEAGKNALIAAKNVILASLKIDPEYADAYVLLGYTETVLKDYKLAANSFSKAEELGTKNIWLIYNRALMLKGLGKPDLVLKEYEKVVGIKPDGGDNDRPLKRVLNKLAYSYWIAGESDKSISTFRQLHKYFPYYYNGNASYIKAAIANGSDQGNVTKIISEYKRKNWDIAYYADSMNTLMNAANQISSNSAGAITAVATAQASNDEFVNVIADLSKGGAGRNALEKLLKAGLLNMESIEKPSSLLLPLIGSKNIKPLKFALKMGANPNQIDKSYYSAPMIKAVMVSRYSEVKLLLDFGADPFLKGANGYSAFDWANRYGKLEILELFDKKVAI